MTTDMIKNVIGATPDSFYTIISQHYGIATEKLEQHTKLDSDDGKCIRCNLLLLSEQDRGKFVAEIERAVASSDAEAISTVLINLEEAAHRNGGESEDAAMASSIESDPEFAEEAEQLKANAVKTYREARQEEILSILNFIQNFTKSEKEARIWFRSTPIYALGGLTAKQLVEDGEAGEVLLFLESVAEDMYA